MLDQRNANLFFAKVLFSLYFTFWYIVMNDILNVSLQNQSTTFSWKIMIHSFAHLPQSFFEHIKFFLETCWLDYVTTNDMLVTSYGFPYYCSAKTCLLHLNYSLTIVLLSLSYSRKWIFLLSWYILNINILVLLCWCLVHLDETIFYDQKRKEKHAFTFFFMLRKEEKKTRKST